MLKRRELLTGAAAIAAMRALPADAQTWAPAVPPSQVPTVVSITPNTGSTGGNRPVTIAGTNFISGATVTIGGVPAVNVVIGGNGLSITCRTGRHAAGAANVVVTTANGSSTQNVVYTHVMQAQGVTLTPPSQASAFGFNTLSFQEEFDDLLSVHESSTNPLVDGYNFYTQIFGWANSAFGVGASINEKIPIQYFYPEYYSITNSVVTMIGHVAPQRDTCANFRSTAFANNAKGYAGSVLPWANGFYTEVRCAGELEPVV
jgi:IPT/TIG domain